MNLDVSGDTSKLKSMHNQCRVDGALRLRRETKIVYYSPEGIVVLRDCPTGRCVKIFPQKLFYRFLRLARATDHSAQFYLFLEAGSAFFGSLARLKEVFDGNPRVREVALVTT